MIRLNTHKTKVLLLVCSSIFVFYCTSYSQTVSSNRFKRIDYEYDLVSGKVNKVSYQKDSADQFIHQYSYDSDNRITKVETSSDNVVWDVDAKYFYYAHGPLARTEIGNDKVQGIDYAYTLQGWIKGVNSNTLDKKRDMGQDGKDTSIYDPSNPQLHANFAQDAFGYSLNYFKGDYKAISQVRWNNATNRFEAVTTGSELMQQTHDLYNGNIKSMVTAITQIDTTSAGNVNPQIPKPLGNAYKYDQLNRIKKSVSFTNIDLIGNLWQSSGQTIANMYGNTFSYDANGNILTQNRSDEIGQEFEALNYKYRTVAGKLRQNRLYHVNDNINYTSLKTDDIDDQGHFAAGASSNPLVDSVGQFNNYSYDNIGNLVKDKAEQIANIEWTVYGKVKRILRTAGSAKDNLVFDYDPNGNRIAKHVYDNANNWKYTTYYLRDAQGNVMCTYEHKNIPPPGGIGSPSMSFVLQEQHIYGNSRLGMYIPNKQLINHSSFTIGFKSHVLGKKLFEMGNHLGNILSVISDKKIPIDNNSDGVIDEYQVDLLTSNDFSPFGVKLYKRGSSLGNYRYGMNGQEKDDEIVGSGNSYDFGARMYNPRLGRWLSLDPLMSKYPNESNYAFVSNNPIIYSDLDGRDKVWFNCEGKEVKRIESKTEFHTYVQVGVQTQMINGNPQYTGKFKEVPMPGVIEGYEDAKYQAMDYQIAASTGLFNMHMAEKDENVATANHQVTTETENPQIDVNLVKAILMQESKVGTDNGGNGTGVEDPMQANYKGDFDASKDVKTAAGLKKGQAMDARTSINAGLKILYLKGMTSDSKGNYTKWKGDTKALDNYNGGGVKGYSKSVMNYFNKMSNSTNNSPTPAPKGKATPLNKSQL